MPNDQTTFSGRVFLLLVATLASCTVPNPNDAAIDAPADGSVGPACTADQVRCKAATLVGDGSGAANQPAFLSGAFVHFGYRPNDPEIISMANFDALLDELPLNRMCRYLELRLQTNGHWLFASELELGAD